MQLPAYAWGKLTGDSTTLVLNHCNFDKSTKLEDEAPITPTATTPQVDYLVKLNAKFIIVKDRVIFFDKQSPNTIYALDRRECTVEIWKSDATDLNGKNRNSYSLNHVLTCVKSGITHLLHFAFKNPLTQRQTAANVDLTLAAKTLIKVAGKSSMLALVPLPTIS
eukprot:GHVT01019239.1.p1 GENE.GHVT01019239.1~~GHVT01019239.1.p1  ORF type:complete len:165 (+),score=8.03 GHVT01019239.1:2455-2949(+)